MLKAVYFFEPNLLLSNVFTSTGILENSSERSLNMIDAWEKLIFWWNTLFLFHLYSLKTETVAKGLCASLQM